MPYEPVNIAFLKEVELTDFRDRLLELCDIDVFLDNLSWTEAPRPFQGAPIRAMAGRQA